MAKLLLTSQGLFNKTISNALFKLAGKRPQDIKVVFIPTAATFMDVDKDWLINQLKNVQKQKFSYIDVVDIAALSKEEWEPRVRKADVIVVGGGNPFDLIKWFKKTGFDKELPELLKTRVYVGNSSGAIVMGKTIPIKCRDFYELETDIDEDIDGLDFVDFTFLSHYLEPDYGEDIDDKAIQKISEEIKNTVYAVDDNSAIVINNGKLAVVTEGKWKKFN
ncbi:MAG: Type 1 glutamine amidotransferase-like domain-containing protein [Patescibacteria group bacterium]|nr:Type 1 glutamine amidotransferase-like domain-containing protein [Patescibacteria group bacterium]